MEKFFDDKGPTDYARRVMLDLTYGLDQLMSSDIVCDMDVQELYILQSHLAHIVQEAVSKKISKKLQQELAFEQMTDDQFYDYLKEKYGTIWQLVTLTKEEYNRVPRLSDEDIRKAIEEGMADRKAIQEAFVPPYIDPGLRFR